LEMIWHYLCSSSEEPMEECMTTTTTTLDQQQEEEEEQDKWKKGWKMIGTILSSNLLSPFCIHDTATQALFLKESGHLDEENKNVPNSRKMTAVSRPVPPSSAGRFYTTTCLLVCCAALQRCPASPALVAGYDSASPPPLSRKKRWRSCMMNTVRLVQQQWLQQQKQQQHRKDYNDDDDDMNSVGIVSVFVHYIVPTCLQVQQTLFHDDSNLIVHDDDDDDKKNQQQQRRSDAWFWQAAIHAGLIATISSMAAANTNFDHAGKNNKRLELLVQTLDRIMVTECGGGSDLHSVWKHPWRKSHRLGMQELLRTDESTSLNHHNNSRHQNARSTIPALAYEESLCYWTAPVLAAAPDHIADDDWDDSGDDDDDQPKSRAYRRSESVARMDTIWNDVGIAVLTTHNLTMDERRPLVYTNRFIWQLCLPHVSTLLLTEDMNDSSMMIDNHDDDVKYRQYHCRQQEKQQLLGYRLLEWLLSRFAEHELSKPVTALDPLSPIPVFQLLSNRIVDTGRAGATPTTAATATTAALPSGYAAYQLMKLLLSKYKLAHQLDLVRTLYSDCPHPGLGPKILDLLRGLLLTLAKIKDQAENPDDLATLRPSLWGYVDTLLRDLDRHVECLDKEILNTNRNQKGHSQSFFLIDTVQEFVADAEKFVSVLTLIRTWMLVSKSNTTDIPHLATRLEAAHNALAIMFEHAENDSVKDINSSATTATSVRPPEQQLFRLQLLMQALEESLQLLKTSGTNG
jgi:hypothetical protein